MKQHLRWLCCVLAALTTSLITLGAPVRGHSDELDAVSLTTLNAVEGSWTVRADVTVRGKLYDSAGLMDSGGKIIFANPSNYDYFEAWIGYREDDGNGVVQFRVRGDGNSIYLSPVFSPRDPALKIRIPIHGYTAITLTTGGKDAGGNSAVWALPRFIKQPRTVPVAVSPDMNETVRRDTPLVWKPVDSATGYLLELQCLDLADAKDEAAENRFSVVRLPANATLYTFAVDKMPKGRWRWRVHALSRTGFLGQMDDWRTFTSQ